MMYLHFLLTMLYVSSLYRPCFGLLKTNQWKQINSLIQRPDLSQEIRVTLNKVIYKHYSGWALYKTIEFKKFHYYKCKHIPLEELHLYCLEGLQKGIERYDASSSFFNYIQYYIRGRLYKGMSELHPLSNTSLRKRMRKQNANTNANTVFVGENAWLFDTAETTESYNNEKNVKIWEFIHHNLSAKDRKIMTYKYDFDFNEIRTNKKVAELMVYSEEKIRTKLHEIRDKLILHVD